MKTSAPVKSGHATYDDQPTAKGKGFYPFDLHLSDPDEANFIYRYVERNRVSRRTVLHDALRLLMAECEKDPEFVGPKSKEIQENREATPVSESKAEKLAEMAEGMQQLQGVSRKQAAAILESYSGYRSLAKADQTELAEAGGVSAAAAGRVIDWAKQYFRDRLAAGREKAAANRKAAGKGKATTKATGKAKPKATGKAKPKASASEEEDGVQYDLASASTVLGKARAIVKRAVVNHKIKGHVDGDDTIVILPDGIEDLPEAKRWDAALEFAE